MGKLLKKQQQTPENSIQIALNSSSSKNTKSVNRTLSSFYINAHYTVSVRTYDYECLKQGNPCVHNSSASEKGTEGFTEHQ